MSLTNPYRQKNYMGEYSVETGGGSVLEFVRANKWDSSEDGLGDPRAGMTYFDSVSSKMKVYSGTVWNDMGSTVSQLSDLSDVGVSTPTAGNLLIADGDSWESQTVSGAILIGGSGATAFNSTAETTVNDADLVLIYDTSETAYRRMTRANFLSGVAGSLQTAYDGGYGIAVATNPMTLTVADDGDSSALTINQNDVTNHPSALIINNTASMVSGSVSIALGGSNRSIGSFDDGTNVGSLFIGVAGTSPTPGGERTLNISAYTYTDNNCLVAINALQAAAGSGGGQIQMEADIGISIGVSIQTPYVHIGTGVNITDITIGTGATSGADRVIEIGNTSASDNVSVDIKATSGDDITLYSRGGSVTVAEAGNASLSGFTATSLIGACNELKSAGGTPPGGSSGQIQWNSASAFAGTDNAYWDDANDALILGSITSVSNAAFDFQLARSDASSCIASTVVSSVLASDTPFIYLVRGRGTQGSPVQVEEYDKIGSINFGGVVHPGWANTASGVAIAAYAAEDWGPGAYYYSGSRLEISTVNIGSGVAPAKRYSIEGNSDHVWYGAGATPSEIMRIDASNEALLLGGATTSGGSVTTPLVIAGENSVKHIRFQIAGDNSWETGYFNFDRAFGTSYASPSALTTDQVLGYIMFRGAYDSSWTCGYGAQIYAITTESWSGSQYGTALRFKTVTNGTTAIEARYIIDGDGDHIWYGAGATPSERLRLENEGPILFPEISAPGTTTNRLYNTSTGLYFDGTRLDVAGALPAGTGTEIQYRVDGTTFGATAVHWDSTYNSMIFGTAATSSPTANSFMPIQIVSAGDYAQIKFSTTGSSNYDNGYLFFSRGDGETFATAGPPKNGYVIGQVCWGGPVGTGWSVEEVAARFVVYASQDWTASVQGVRLMFETIKNGDDAEEDRFGITGDGNTEFYIDDGVTPGFSTVYGKAGVLIGNATSDPATPSDGQLYYKSDTDKLRLRANSTWVDLSPGGSSGQIQWNSTLSFAGTDQAYWDDTYKALLIGGPTTAIYDSVAYPLQLVRNGTAGIGMLSVGTADDLRSFLYLGRAKGTWAAPLAVTSGSELGSVNFVGLSASGIANRQTGVELRAYASEAWSGTQYGTKFDIATVTNGTTSLELRYGIDGSGDHVWYGAGASPTERLRLENEGPILFPEISAPGTTTNRLYNTSTGLYFDGTRLDVASATPGGSSTEIQYRSGASTFGGASLYWDAANTRLGHAVSSPESLVHIRSVDTGTGEDREVNLETIIADISASMLLGFKKQRAGSVAQVDDLTGTIAFYSYSSDGGNSYKNNATIYTQVKDTVYGRAKFVLKTNATVSGYVDRWIFDSNGDNIWYDNQASPGQLFKLDANNIYAVAPSRAGEPTAVEGAFFYDTTADVFKFGQGSTPAWVTIGAGATPGGSTPQLQYNDGAGGFAAATNLRYDATSGMLVSSASATAWPYTTTSIGLGVVRDNDLYAGIGAMRVGNNDPQSYAPFFATYQARGTRAAPEALDSGDLIGSFATYGIRGSAWNEQGSGGVITSIATEDWTLTATGSKLNFSTCKNTESALHVRYSINSEDAIWYDNSDAQIARMDASSKALLIGSQTGTLWATTQASMFVVGDDVYPLSVIASASPTAIKHGQLLFFKSAGSIASPTATPDTSVLGQIAFGGLTGTSWTTDKVYGVQIEARAADSYGTNPTTLLEIRTIQAGSSTGAARYRIEGNGDHVWWGTGASPSEILRLYASGDIEQTSTAFHYWGDPSTNGSFRAGIVSDVFVIQQRYNDSWTTVHEFYISPAS